MFKHFLVWDYQGNSFDGLNLGVMTNIVTNNEVSVQDFKNRLIEVCKKHFDTDDIVISETHENNIAEHLVDQYWNFEVEILCKDFPEVDDEVSIRTLVIQQTWLY